MDKSYYCRVLGVREDASVQQIKQAYEERVKRLKSPDYADDSEYVSRKLGEAAYAYRVLLGAEAPSTKQRKNHYDKLKDSMEKDETTGGGKTLRKVRKSSGAIGDASKNVAATVSAAGEKLKENAEETLGRVVNSKEAKSAMGIVFSIIIAVVSLAVGACESEPTPEYTYENTDMELNRQAVERILDRSEEYDFFGVLDKSIVSVDDKIEWEVEENADIMNGLWKLNEELSQALGINSLYYGIGYYTGIEDYGYDISDYEASQLLAEMMGAPEFEEVAGKFCMYSMAPILNYSDYMRFLIDVASWQTDEICGELVYY